MLGGGGNITHAQLGSGVSVPSAAEIGPAPQEQHHSTGSDHSDEVIEAEIVDMEQEALLEEQLRSLAGIHSLDEQGFVDGVWMATAGDLHKIETMIRRADEGVVIPRRVNDDGTIEWEVPK